MVVGMVWCVVLVQRRQDFGCAFRTDDSWGLDEPAAVRGIVGFVLMLVLRCLGLWDNSAVGDAIDFVLFFVVVDDDRGVCV